MKPIEIHVEGYKIVISEDDKKLQNESIDKKDDDDSLKLKVCPPYVPCPYVPYVPPTIQPQDDWWRYPYVTWTNEDSLSNIKTTSADVHPVRDIMTGKDNHEEVE